MMANLKNPDQIGSGMALAMIGTLYGLLLGTLFYGPFSEKISLEGEKNLQIDLMVLEGVLTLKGKKSSIHMRDIMNTYSQGKKAAGQNPAEAPKRS
jgi:chemotaxis protein MotA